MSAPLTMTSNPGRAAIPPALLIVCIVLAMLHAGFFPTFYSRGWIIEPDGLGSPTDFVNVWSAGRLVLDGHPAWAYDWDIQKKI